MGGLPVHRHATAEFCVVISSEHEVLRHAQRPDQSLTLTIFGDVGHSLHVTLARVVVGDVIPSDGDRSARSSTETGDCIDQFGLPLPCTPAMPTISQPARRNSHHRRPHVHQGPRPASFDREHDFTWRSRCLTRRQLHGASNHHLGDLRLGGRCRKHFADDLAATQHADAVRDGQALPSACG